MTAADVLLCPACSGALELTARDARCTRCAASYPRDGVVDLLPDQRSEPSPAQRAMQARAIVRIYESRLWRRSLPARAVLGLSFAEEARLVLDAATLDGARAVLDLACGPGIYTRRVARRAPGAAVIGVDLSRPMLRVAVQRTRAARLDNVTFVHADATRLPLADGRFDAAVCCGALHLFPDPARALAELARVLAPGARLALAVSRAGNGAFDRVSAKVRIAAGVACFGEAELAGMLRAAGFTGVQHHFAKRAWLVTSARRHAED